MKLKKYFVMLMMMFSLNSSIPLSTSSVDNVSIIVNDEKIPLRQRAIKKENDSLEQANIETTNVDYDLRYLYGGEKNYLKFNIWDLVPTTETSKDTSYKFLCAKPVDKNLYLYIYNEDNRNGDILNALFCISKSKEQNQETGEFIEDFRLYNARFINSYGYKKRFIKVAIDDIINLEEDVRILIDYGTITYQDVSTLEKYYKYIYNIKDEFFFNNSDDFTYEYFKDEYIKITDGYVSGQIVGNTPISGINNSRIDRYYSYDENFYYFFNMDKNVDDIVQIQYDYELISYNAKWHTGALYNGIYSIDQVPCYPYDMSGEAYEITDEIIQFYANQKIDSGYTLVEVERPWFFGWNQTKKYSQENIINLSKLDNIDDEVTRNWFNEKKNYEGKNYKWCFKITSTQRKAIQAGSGGNWWSDLWGYSEMNSNSSCHEIKQSMIVWMKCRIKNKDIRFNVLDIPKDTSEIAILYIPYETLVDVVVDKVVSFWDWLKGSFKTIGQNIVPILITIAVILIVVLCWPLLSSLFGNVNSVNESIKNKRTKRKKRKK